MKSILFLVSIISISILFLIYYLSKPNSEPFFLGISRDTFLNFMNYQMKSVGTDIQTGNTYLEIPSGLTTAVNSPTPDNKIYLVKNNDVYILTDNKLVSREKVDKLFSIPMKTIDTLAVHNNKLFYISNNLAYFIDNPKKQVKLTELYPGLPTTYLNSSRIKSIVNVSSTQTYFFYADKVIKYDKYNKYDKYDSTEKGLNNTKENTVSSLFEGVPSDFEVVFIDTEDISSIGKSEPILIFVKSKKYYRYSLGESKLLNKNSLIFKDRLLETYKREIIDNHNETGFLGPTETALINKKNDNIIKVVSGIQTYSVPTTGDYRIKTVGAGLKNSGMGGMVFADYHLNKGDLLNIVVGQRGYRPPSIENSYEKNNNRLPVNVSNSGSGASAVFLGNKCLMVAGGGGGFSSAIVPVPNICHSVFPSSNTSKNNPQNDSNYYYCLTGLSIKSPKGTSDNRYKIVINQIKLNNFNNDKITIERIPNNTYKPKETEFCDIDKNAIVYINFNEDVVSLGMILDFTVYDVNYKVVKQDTVSLFDSNNQVIFIENYQEKFNGKIMDGRVLLLSQLNTKPLVLFSNNIQSSLAKDGFTLQNSRKNLNDLIDSGKNNSITNDNPKRLRLFGGFPGGGVSTYSLNSNGVSHCGGGSGWKGGRGITMDFLLNTDNTTNKIEYLDKYYMLFNGRKVLIPLTAACGGTSYVNDNVKELIKSKNIDKRINYYIDNFNDTNGKVIIYFLKDANDANSEKKVIKDKSTELKIENIYNDLSEETKVNYLTGKLKENLSIIRIPLSSNLAKDTLKFKLVLYPSQEICHTYSTKNTIKYCFMAIISSQPDNKNNDNNENNDGLLVDRYIYQHIGDKLPSYHDNLLSYYSMNNKAEVPSFKSAPDSNGIAFMSMNLACENIYTTHTINTKWDNNVPNELYIALEAPVYKPTDFIDYRIVTIEYNSDLEEKRDFDSILENRLKIS